MITYPLNNIDYMAEDAELFHCTRTSGIWAEDSFPISVTGADNNVTIGTGIAWINNEEFSGKVTALKTAKVLDMGIADGVYPRIDVIAIQYSANNNATDVVIKKGTPATNPVRPAIVRSGAVYELYLASVYRPTGATAITASNITDLRMNNTVCGLMADSVTKVDMDAIRAQLIGLVEELEEAIQNIEVGEIVPIEKGGTSASTSANARQNINFIGINPIASVEEDMPANWATFGTGVARISGTGLLNEQPSSYGVLENIPLNYDGTNVMQRFVATSSYEDINGAEFYRVGNGTEWLFGWRKTIGYGTDGSTITAGNVPFGLHALTVGCSVEKALSTAAGKVTCGRVYSNTNAVTSGILEARNGGIKVLRRGRYLVSASVYGSNMTVGDALSAAIYQGTSATAGAYAQTAGRTYTTVSIPPRVLSLAAGETFYLYAYNINSATGIIEASNNTLLTVIAID